jgi:hypothetical protein
MNMLFPEKVGVGREFKYGKVTCEIKCSLRYPSKEQHPGTRAGYDSRDTVTNNVRVHNELPVPRPK